MCINLYYERLMTIGVAYVFYTLVFGSKICNFMLRNIRLIRTLKKQKIEIMFLKHAPPFLLAGRKAQ
jgi:hypothetical protein